MLCEKCGKNVATTHLKRTINGNTTELHLCSACAAQEGIGGMFGGLKLGNFWGSLLAEPAISTAGDFARCEGCGKTYREIASSGQAGCPSCYTAFYDRLLPSIQRIHGKTVHVGKTPAMADSAVQRERELRELRDKLSRAIAAQEYEKCAALRDRIRELEGGTDNE